LSKGAVIDKMKG